ncbi:MAG: hypothetical protein J6Y82_00385 [Bacteroidales bacterium]|nr:hypothetical protein [Bacteroidales bacterium]
MRKIFVMLCVCVSCILNAQENVLSSEKCSETMAAIYSLDEAKFTTNLTQVTDKALAAYLTEYWALMKYTSANNKQNYKTYMQKSDDALDAVEDHKYEYTLRSNILIHRCLVDMSEGNMLSGGIQFWKSYRAFKEGEEKYPNYDGQLMLRGIYNILLSQIPDKWRGLAGFFGFGKGDLKKGFEQISAYREKVKNVVGVGEESLVVSFANFFLSQEQTVSAEMATAMKSSKSPLVLYAYLLSMGRKQRGAEADEVLQSIDSKLFTTFPLLYQQKSKFALRRLDADNCITYADKFLRIYKGIACLNDAYLLKGYAYLLKGDAAQAQQFGDKCAAMSASSDVDKRTQADAKRMAITDVEMLKARMQFEYGNFSESRKILASMTPKPSDILEYHFRIGRAEDMMGNRAAANKSYQQVVSLSGNDKRYFGPYAAVYQAEIKMKAGDKAAAKQLLAKAKSMNNGEFSKEIDQRIAIDLRTIEEQQ